MSSINPQAYPLLVNGSTHSLHMASHIFVRAGEFARASESDQASVDASDAFNFAFGALSYQGGPIGTSAFPAQVLYSPVLLGIKCAVMCCLC